MSEVKRFDVPSMRSLIQGEQAVMGYEVVLASDYDALAAEAQALREEVAALRAKLAMAEDAAAKGDAARQQCGGMEMEIEELRAELETLRARVVVPDGYALMPLEPYPEMRLASHRYKRKNKVSTGPGFWRAMAEAAPRLNGKTVSEGLLREVARHLGNWLELHECECDGGFHYCGRDQVAKTNRELRALLSEQE
ncbi:TPA: hypothetical protein L4847_006725 [Pseudomonas aeruginosa]|uniref:hypothetical protein n=1 Tax=Pseudomonas aeruginosa TaxID=287 RepID=UPI00068E6350|nr:hypothetical protein [Pseudomonas aeruginosa]MBG7550562.1 hypothetical protein [Pseudomonas aeruginosa]MCR3831335.1 hypothetical protein [Pseudomonas aeruginosa]MCU9031656.1 hypothetical protein [Pseudomonas aeruginosa]HBO7092376.1 hypothetical protein [Pseudomonas aeruginosa]HBO7138941.1 hypothetical protein [Pseudomonas aeruginosa]